jgi:predicted dehydrogenase
VYKIGVVGCGRISHQHFKAAQDLAPRAQITAACEVDPVLLNKACDEFSIEQRFRDVSQLAASDVDAVILITPPHVRLSIARPLLEAGKHLLIEKPFAESLDEARAIVNLADQTGCKVAINQNYRWYDGVSHMRQMIVDGKIGAPTYAIINDCVWRDEVSGWRKDTNRLALAVMGVHWLDRFRWLLMDEPIAATCITAHRDTLASGGENETTSIIEFRSGAMATLTHSWSSHARQATNFQQFDGPLGSLILHGEKEVLYKSSAGDETFNFEYSFTRSFGESLTRLLDAVETNTEPPHSARDNLMTMALLEACYQSAAEKRRVEIAPETTGVHS